LRKFGGQVDLALAAYNAGEGTVSSFRTGKPLVLPDGRVVNPRGVVTGGVPPYAETQRYVRSVLTMLNSTLNGRVERPPLRLRFDLQRDLTLDAFDVSERGQKFSKKRGSSFIEVP
jgi:hypothetical protein